MKFTPAANKNGCTLDMQPLRYLAINSQGFMASYPEA